jgi:hypothetical protein
LNQCTQEIFLRLFDETNRMVWPADSTHVYALDPGPALGETLSCTTGAKICFGASGTMGRSQLWGVGIDNTQPCADCCATCGDADPPTIPLTCP